MKNQLHIHLRDELQKIREREHNTTSLKAISFSPNNIMFSKNPYIFKTEQEKNKERYKNYYQKNKTKLALQKKEHYQKNKLKYAIAHKKYYQENKDKKKQYHLLHKKENAEYLKQYHKKHRKKILEYQKENYKKNIKNIRIKQKKYKQTMKGKFVAYKTRLKRRIKLKKLRIEGSHTLKEWQKLLNNSKGICKICNIFIGKKKLTKDHIIPVTHPTNASDKIENIQVACRSCNTTKGGYK